MRKRISSFALAKLCAAQATDVVKRLLGLAFRLGIISS